MKKTLAAILILLAMLASCGTSELDPVSESDLAILTQQESTDEITVSDQPGIFVTGEQPESVTFTYDSVYTLRYTTDCSTPTAESAEYTGPIELKYTTTLDAVSSTSTLRAALFDGDTRVSLVYSYSYIHAYEGRFDMPVMSLVTDDDNLYGYELGILVSGKTYKDAILHGNPLGWVQPQTPTNYYMGGIEWERPVTYSLFDLSGQLQYSLNCGVRVNGGYQRAQNRKSLKFYARRAYTPDQGKFEANFWPGYRTADGTPVSTSDTVLYRSGSNNEPDTVFSTPFALSLLEKTTLDSPANQPTVEYLNGQYNGVFVQQEDYDLDYFEVHYGVPEDKITTLNGIIETRYDNAGWQLDDGCDAEFEEFQRLAKWITRTDLTVQKNYETLCTMFDIENFIQYVAYNAYLANGDWPHNNLRAWRYNADGYYETAPEDPSTLYHPENEGVYDGRWRFMCKDLDLSMDYRDVSSDPYEYMYGSSSMLIKNWYTSLMKNREFRQLYYSAMCNMATAVMTPEICEDTMDYLMLITGREMEYSIQGIGSVASGSRTNWNNSLNHVRDFMQSRASNVLSFTKVQSGKNLTTLTLHITDGGTAAVCWTDIENGEKRQYPRNNIIPFEVTPDPGFTAEISYEGCALNEDGYLVISESKSSITVTFTKTAEDPVPGVVINEVLYRNTEHEWIELYNSSDKAVSLSGWMIGKSDEDDAPDPADGKTFGSATIQPGGYALICLTNYGNTYGYTGLRAVMSLGNGDTLTLYDASGNVIDSVLLQTKISTVHLGRYPDGGSMMPLSFDEATPGSANGIKEDFGLFGVTSVQPYLLAFGHPLEFDDYFYWQEDVLYVKSKKLAELYREYGVKSHYKYLHNADNIPLSELIEAMEGSDEAHIAFVEELGCVIIS